MSTVPPVLSAPIWTPVALSSDLPAATAIPGVCDGVDLAIWRGASGRVAVWRDRCPHRGMRLSHGFVRGDMLSCIYHGWRFDGASQCRKIPAHPDLEPPAAIRATAIAGVEAHGVIWAALEAPEVAPPDLGPVVPLRSLRFAAPLEVVAELAGITGVTARLSGLPLTMLLQRLPDGGCAAHCLLPEAEPALRLTASRALEDLRRRAEAKEEIAA